MFLSDFIAKHAVKGFSVTLIVGTADGGRKVYVIREIGSLPDVEAEVIDGVWEGDNQYACRTPGYGR